MVVRAMNDGFYYAYAMVSRAVSLDGAGFPARLLLLQGWPLRQIAHCTRSSGA